MLKKLLLVILVVIVTFLGFVFTKFELDKQKKYQVAEFDISAEMNSADITLGQRIYAIRAGCVDCHGENLAGNMIMDNGAMGTIYGANITPFNLKSWTDAEILRAIRYGVHKSGRSLRFMPSFDYVGYSKGDLVSLVKYIRSVPEVTQQSHENTFGPIAKMLSAFGKMPIMFPAKVLDLNQGFAEKPLEEANIEFGKYLANSCMGCHGQEFKGGPIPGGDPSWAEAANIRLGANPLWTKEKLIQMMKSGISPITKKELRPPMPSRLFKQYNETEIEALWLYLSSLK